MTRQKHLMSIVLLLVAALLLFTVPAAARATKTDFTGTITGGIVDLGTWTYPGGNVHIRGMTEVYDVAATDSRLSGGVCTIVVSGNLDPEFVGPISFKWHIEVEGQGSWEGTGTGKLSGADDSLSVSAVGHGRGDFEGLELRFTVTGPLDAQDRPMSGYILNPHGE